MTPEQMAITQRLEKALYDSGQQPLINERHSEDIKLLKGKTDRQEGRLRAAEVTLENRFTREAAKELFAELFAADIKRREELARLVKLIYVPLGLLAAGVFLDLVKGLLKW